MIKKRTPRKYDCFRTYFIDEIPMGESKVFPYDDKTYHCLRSLAYKHGTQMRCKFNTRLDYNDDGSKKSITVYRTLKGIKNV